MSDAIVREAAELHMRLLGFALDMLDKALSIPRRRLEREMKYCWPDQLEEPHREWDRVMVIHEGNSFLKSVPTPYAKFNDLEAWQHFLRDRRCAEWAMKLGICWDWGLLLALNQRDWCRVLAVRYTAGDLRREMEAVVQELEGLSMQVVVEIDTFWRRQGMPLFEEVG
jgi:hypothetical protein